MKPHAAHFAFARVPQCDLRRAGDASAAAVSDNRFTTLTTSAAVRG
jgi:hypothetical protein